MDDKQPNEDVTTQALLLQLAAKASTVSVGMLIPPMLGIALDRLFGTIVLFLVIGVILGMAITFWQLLRFGHE